MSQFNFGNKLNWKWFENKTGHIIWFVKFYFPLKNKVIVLKVDPFVESAYNWLNTVTVLSFKKEIDLQSKYTVKLDYNLNNWMLLLKPAL